MSSPPVEGRIYLKQTLYAAEGLHSLRKVNMTGLSNREKYCNTWRSREQELTVPAA